jgi:hypothetical protein
MIFMMVVMMLVMDVGDGREDNNGNNRDCT